MKTAGKLLLRKTALELAAIVLLFALSVAGVFNPLNRVGENTFTKLAGQRPLDSSVVIIHIDGNDIEKLGGWPLKRSYYALLVSRLSDLGVSKIGI